MSFDITKHKWSCEDLSLYFISELNNDLHLLIDICCGPIASINKQDAIAIAKHFKLTTEDLEQ